MRPASLITIDLATQKISTQVRWWNPEIGKISHISFEEAAKILRSKILSSVDLHLRSDVPVAAALSGGLDSSTIVCCVRELRPDVEIDTFSYSAVGSPLDESRWAAIVASHAETTQHEVCGDPEDALDALDAIIRAQGEPFGSTSIYAQFRVFESVAEAGFKACLDGQGADELLAGYSGYPGYRMLSLIEQGHFLSAAKFARAWSQLPGRHHLTPWQHLAALILPKRIVSILYSKFRSPSRPAWLVQEFFRGKGVKMRYCPASRTRGARGRRLTEALISGLDNLDSLLRHEDRNSMHFSVESRVPFLTIEIAEFLFSLPENYLVGNDGITKSVLREAMRHIVPEQILDRTDKIGFATPEPDWLVDWVRDRPDILSVPRELSQVINEVELRRMVQEILDGQRAYTSAVWRCVCLISWFNAFFKSRDTQSPEN